MYIEDDWELMDDFHFTPSMLRLISSPPQNSGSRQDEFAAVLNWSRHILDSSIDIHQVLINTQWDRSCSLGDMSSCASPQLASGGWLRAASTPPSDNVTNIPVSTSNTEGLEFSLHEFGLFPSSAAARRHDFSYWPGFSLNPGLWDTKKITESLHNCSKSNDESRVGTRDPYIWANYFSETDDAFEQQFSVRAHGCGVHMAYLHAVLFQHIGSEVSAYKLNGVSRPWEQRQQ